RWPRRLSLCAARDRQYRHRGPGEHAPWHGHSDRRRSRYAGRVRRARGKDRRQAAARPGHARRGVAAERAATGLMRRPDSSSLRCFFEPKSIAVIGASRTPGRPGHTLVENLRKAFAGQIYPINTQAGEVAGLPAFPSVAEVPGDVELAVVLVPAESVPQAVMSCAQKGVRGVVVEAADFAEIGAEGRLRQVQIADIARNAGMRLWGPNCLGVIDARSGVITTYQPLRDVVPGHTSLITQSGALAGAVLAQIHEARTFAFNKVCSIGNKADVDECDLLEYLAGDPSTRVIGMYLE